MNHLLLLLAFAPPSLQEDESREVAGWVERLGSDDLDVREEATRRLQDLGRAAEPAIRKATESKDTEIASRARRLLNGMPLFQCRAILNEPVGSALVDRVVRLESLSSGPLEGVLAGVSSREFRLRVDGETTPRRVRVRDLTVPSVYKACVEALGAPTGPARLEFAERCVEDGLYGEAALHFEEAGRLDASLADKCRQRRAAAMQSFARTRLEQARRWVTEGKYEEANAILRLVITECEETSWLEEAKALVGEMAEALQKENERLRKRLNQKEGK